MPAAVGRLVALPAGVGTRVALPAAVGRVVALPADVGNMVAFWLAEVGAPVWFNNGGLETLPTVGTVVTLALESALGLDVDTFAAVLGAIVTFGAIATVGTFVWLAEAIALGAEVALGDETAVGATVWLATAAGVGLTVTLVLATVGLRVTPAAVGANV